MKLTIALDQLSPKALTAIGNLQTAIAARLAAETSLSAAQKKEEAALSLVQSLGIHLTGQGRTAPARALEIDVPAGMLTTRQAAKKLGLAISTMSKFTGRSLPVAQRFKTPQGPTVNLFREADVAAFHLKRQVMQKAITSPEPRTSPAQSAAPAPAKSVAPAPAKTAPETSVAAPIEQTPPVKSPSVQIKSPPVQTQPLPAPTKVAPPTPTFDTNENGKLAAIEEGKTSFKESALFYLIRLTEGKQWLWDSQPNTVVAEGWELVEEWRRNGLNRWESTPSEPGVVGTGNGVTYGIREGKLV